MKKPGKFPEDESSVAAVSTVDLELQRLRKAGMSDLAMRPGRYPVLVDMLTSTSGPLPSDVLGRLAMCKKLFRAVIAALPSAGLRQATAILFHVDGTGVAPPLDVRRRAADQAYRGRGIGREPDTVQRYLERQVLDPLLVEIIEALPEDAFDTPLTELEPRSPWDIDAWADDLDRALISITRQDFRFASELLDRWLRLGQPEATGDAVLNMRARSLMLVGDLRRDQGLTSGPLSAEKAYQSALGLFAQLGNTRRMAQGELSLALVAEMSGNISLAAARYGELAEDDRLTPRDRARARLWVGTAVTKRGDYDHAVEAIGTAMYDLDRLDELDEWAVGQQKLALAHLLAGRLPDATQHMEVALRHRKRGAPLQEIRLDVAHAHLLVADRRTRDSGLALLGKTRLLAADLSLGHQVRSIEQIVTVAEQHERLEKKRP